MVEIQREYPEAPVLAVGIIVRRDGEVLLVKRGQEPAEGRWSLPGGIVRLGETVDEAAQREVREECGLDVEVGAVADVYEAIILDEDGTVQFHYVIIDLLADYRGGTLCVGDDVSEARWLGSDELDDLDVTEDAVELVKEVLAG